MMGRWTRRMHITRARKGKRAARKNFYIVLRPNRVFMAIKNQGVVIILPAAC